MAGVIRAARNVARKSGSRYLAGARRLGCGFRELVGCRHVEKRRRLMHTARPVALSSSVAFDEPEEKNVGCSQIPAIQLGQPVEFEVGAIDGFFGKAWRC